MIKHLPSQWEGRDLTAASCFYSLPGLAGILRQVPEGQAYTLTELFHCHLSQRCSLTCIARGRDRYPFPGTKTQVVSSTSCFQTLSLGGGNVRSLLSSLAQSCYTFPIKAYSLYSLPHNSMAFSPTHLSMVAGYF